MYLTKAEMARFAAALNTVVNMAIENSCSCVGVDSGHDVDCWVHLNCEPLADVCVLLGKLKGDANA